MKLGAGYPMGPFELADYVGLDTTKFILDGKFSFLENAAKTLTWLDRFCDSVLLLCLQAGRKKSPTTLCLPILSCSTSWWQKANWGRRPEKGSTSTSSSVLQTVTVKTRHPTRTDYEPKRSTSACVFHIWGGLCQFSYGCPWMNTWMSLCENK